MKKTVLSCGILLCLVALCAMCLVACNKVAAPKVAIDEAGKVTWNAVKGAIHYVVELDGEEIVTQETFYQLEEGQSARVKGVLAKKETQYSERVTFAEHQHIWEQNPSEETLVSAATCTQAATYKEKCSVCGKEGEVYEYGEIDASNHDWQKTETVVPTCEEGGYDVWVCTRCQESKQDNVKAAFGHDYKGVVATYALAEGSKTCQGGVVEQKTCNVCHKTQSFPVLDGEHHYNEAVYDLAQYGCGHAATVAVYQCPCGHQYTDVKTKCTLHSDEYASVCTECGFHYVYEKIEEINEHCHLTSGSRYLYYLTDRKDGLVLESIEVEPKLIHEPEYSESSEESDQDGQLVKTERYQNRCTRCGIVVSHGYRITRYDGDTAVWLETGEYYVDIEDMEQGEIKRSVLVSAPYGGASDTQFAITLHRTETRDLEGNVLAWQEREITWNDESGYCQKLVRNADSDGFDETVMETDHEYVTVAVEAQTSCCEAGKEIQRCIWCNQERETTIAALGHTYIQHAAYSGYVCLRCGKESAQSIESVYLEDVTAQQEDKTYYWVRAYDTTGQDLEPEGVLTVQTDIEQLDLPVDPSLIERVDDLYRIKISSLKSLAKTKNCNTYEHLTLTMGDGAIRLDHSYTYSFAATDKGVQRTATCAICGDSVTTTLPVTATEPLEIVATRSGVFAFAFVPQQNNTHHIYVEGCDGKAPFSFQLFDDDWHVMAVSINDGQPFMYSNLSAEKTYYVVPVFGTTELPAITLYAELYCTHDYLYDYVEAEGVVTQTGECLICGKKAETVQWHIQAQDGLVLQAQGKMLRYAFVPAKSGDYKFYGEGATFSSTNANLYDEEMTRLAVSGLEDNNFVIAYTLEEGKTYYLSPIFYPDDTLYSLHVMDWCIHNYQCNYVVIEEGIVQNGACTKCGKVWTRTVYPIALEGENTAMIVIGDEKLTFSFEPQESGAYVVEIPTNYEFAIFVEIALDGVNLEYTDDQIAVGRKQTYSCEAGRSYRITIELQGDFADSEIETVRVLKED